MSTLKPVANTGAPGAVPPADLPPRAVAVAGDWHGNNMFAISVIRKIAHRLPPGSNGVIIHTGDFGVESSAEGRLYLNSLNTALGLFDLQLWFVDGNHEDHDELALLEKTYTASRPGPPYYLRERIAWLPRGHRWEWHGRTWLALGGAVSVDKARRTEGLDWWPGETITPVQAAQAAAAGHADVMITHDCPAGVIHALPSLPDWCSPADVAAAEAHARQLQGVVEAVQPQTLFHGHLHLPYQRTCDFGWGPLEVTGLACDGRSRNWVLVNPESMQIAWPPDQPSAWS